MGDDILDLIDGAIGDYLSQDAMRWKPDPSPGDETAESPLFDPAWVERAREAGVLEGEAPSWLQAVTWSGLQVWCNGVLIGELQLHPDEPGMYITETPAPAEPTWQGFTVTCVAMDEAGASSTTGAASRPEPVRVRRDRDRPAWQSPHGPAQTRRRR